MQNEPDPSGPDDSTSDLGASQSNGITLDQQQAEAAGIVNPMDGDEYTLTIKIGDTSAGISAQILDGSAVKSEPQGDSNNVGEPNKEETNDPNYDEDEADDETEQNGTPPIDSLAVKPAPKGPAKAMPTKKGKQHVMSPSQLGISMTSGLG